MTPPAPPAARAAAGPVRLARGWSQQRLAAELAPPPAADRDPARDLPLGTPGAAARATSGWAGSPASSTCRPSELRRGRARAAAARPAAAGPSGPGCAPEFGGPAGPGARWLADPRRPRCAAGRRRRPAGRGRPPGVRPRPGGARGPGRGCAGSTTCSAGPTWPRSRRARLQPRWPRPSRRGPGRRRRLLPALAEAAQLAGWLAADAGDPAAALARLPVGTAGRGGGRRPAARRARARLRPATCWPAPANPAPRCCWPAPGRRGAAAARPPALRALLLHRVALRRRLSGAGAAADPRWSRRDRALQRRPPRRRPRLALLARPTAELAAMTGRDPGGAGPATAGRPPAAAGRRAHADGCATAAVYGSWLARALTDLGEVEQACAVAGDAALLDAIGSGSARAGDGQAGRRTPGCCGTHRDVPAVRRLRRAGPRVPAPACRRRPGRRTPRAGLTSSPPHRAAAGHGAAGGATHQGTGGHRVASRDRLASWRDPCCPVSPVDRAGLRQRVDKALDRVPGRPAGLAGRRRRRAGPVADGDRGVRARRRQAAAPGLRLLGLPGRRRAWTPTRWSPPWPRWSSSRPAR